MLRHRLRQNDYKVVVRNLVESTEYFFRLRVVGKNNKRGSPGPELKAITKCGSMLFKFTLSTFVKKI